VQVPQDLETGKMTIDELGNNGRNPQQSVHYWAQICDAVLSEAEKAADVLEMRSFGGICSEESEK